MRTLHDVSMFRVIFFFFQAEDGIRDKLVTGVQTCALPIADLIHVVANGLPASAMPYWRDILDSVETRAVVAYVKSMSRGFERPAPAPLPGPPRAAPTAASIARGPAPVTAKGCLACPGPHS